MCTGDADPRERLKKTGNIGRPSVIPRKKKKREKNRDTTGEGEKKGTRGTEKKRKRRRRIRKAIKRKDG